MSVFTSTILQQFNKHRKKRHNSKLVHNPTYLNIETLEPKQENWEDFYGKVKKQYHQMHQNDEDIQSSSGFTLTQTMWVTR